MLYLTTRDDRDAYTAYKTLTDDVAPDGGMYIPFRLPVFDRKQLDELLDLGSCECIASVLNRFFPSRLSAWDVETCIGRNPIKTGTVGRKTLVADVWCNPGGSYEYVVSSLNDKLVGMHHAPICSWTRVAVGVAVVFGIFGELRRSNLLKTTEAMDVCVMDGDLSLPSAMVYSAQMGLPINHVIICSKRNSAIWDLVNHGQMGTSLLQPDQKVAMERLIYSLLGKDQIEAFSGACQRHGVYTVPIEQLDVLPAKLFGAVVGTERINSIISNVSNSSGYILSSDAAACYGGIQDYRSKTGQGGLALLFGLVAPNS